ncbi:hypothetical protein LUZ60_004507 [Juncus effusus]|nr:hypothetical protein LUZ60_004507 [Juncus effusus]
MAAEAREDNNNIVRTWVRQIKDLAYEIEDCLAEFTLHFEHRGRWYKLLALGTRHQIASNIRDIKAKVQEVSQRNMRYTIIEPLDSRYDTTSSYAQLSPRTSALFEEDSHFLDGPKATMIEWMNIKMDKQLSVIGVVGMGGLGKTTLAKKVYDSPEIKSQFTYRAWITVSQSFEMRDLIREMIKQLFGGQYDLIGNQDGGMKRVDQIILSLKDKLKDKAYFVVLDDLWTPQAWNSIKQVFPNNGKGSRVIVTTQNSDVAQDCDSLHTYIYRLGPLSDKDSHDLFLKKINRGNENYTLTEELKSVTTKILKKCGGLPLAIVTIAGLLANKPKRKEEWQKLLNHLGVELDTNPSAEPVKEILILSYNDLPYHLKTCLLYLSIFPEDFEIKRKRLVNRWVAEGFVREKSGLTPEDVADEYFYELIGRSLIQSSRVGIDGTIKSCRVHDITRELIVGKAIEEKFVFITGFALPEGIGNLKELQELLLARVGAANANAVDELQKLHQLKKLGVLVSVGKITSTRFIISIYQLSCLRSLDIKISSSGKAIRFLDSDTLPLFDNLKSLNLEGPIGRLPNWVGSLDKLMKLKLHETELEDGTISILQELPNLVLLSLSRRSYLGCELVFGEGTALKKLKMLQLQLGTLETLNFEELALPQFEILEIQMLDGESDLVIMGIPHLSKLKRMTIGNSHKVANLDTVQQHVESHPNHPVLEV